MARPQPKRAQRHDLTTIRSTAAQFEPAAFRAFWKIIGMTCTPDEVYTDPHVVACTHQVISDHASGPPMTQPARKQLLAALAT
jgi:hypothetical protein